MTLQALHRTLDQELVAILRRANLECPVCGEFVLHEPALVRCPECGMVLHGRVDELDLAAPARAG